MLIINFGSRSGLKAYVDLPVLATTNTIRSSLPVVVVPLYLKLSVEDICCTNPIHQLLEVHRLA